MFRVFSYFMQRENNKNKHDCDINLFISHSPACMRVCDEPIKTIYDDSQKTVYEKLHIFVAYSKINSQEFVGILVRGSMPHTDYFGDLFPHADF